MPDSKLLFLLLAGALALHAAATHFTCTWQIGPLQPTNYGFQHYCAASIAEPHSDDVAVFKCEAGSANDLAGVQVADYGIFHPNLLELGTPCGGSGYGFNSDGRCYGPYWSVCIGEIESGACFYLAAKDDCGCR